MTPILTFPRERRKGKDKKTRSKKMKQTMEILQLVIVLAMRCGLWLPKFVTGALYAAVAAITSDAYKLYRQYHSPLRAYWNAWRGCGLTDAWEF